MNNQDIISKLKKISHVIAVILKISQVFCIVGLCILAATMIYVGVFHGLTDVPVNEHLTIKPPISKDILESLGSGKILLNSLIAGIKVATYLAIFIIAKKIFDDVAASDTPFKTVHSNRMRAIAVLMFIANVFNTSAQETGISFGMDFSGLVGALIIFGLSYVFDYGCRLQQE